MTENQDFRVVLQDAVATTLKDRRPNYGDFSYVMDDTCEALAAWIMDALSGPLNLLHEVALSGVERWELDHPGMSYVTIQVDKRDWAELQNYA